MVDGRERAMSMHARLVNKLHLRNVQIQSLKFQ